TRLTRQGQGIQLAASTRGEVHPDAAAVLAQGNEPIDPRWNLDHTASQGGPAAFATERTRIIRMPEATRSPRASNATECTEGGYLVSVGNLSGKFILSSTSISIETPANGAYRSKTRRGARVPRS